MKNRRVIVPFLVFLASSLGAQELPLWQRIGPDGGSICAFAAAPSKAAVVYAGGGDGGVFRSVDRGLTWTFAGADLGPNAVCSLAVDALRPGRIWAIADGRLFRSTNGGRRWLPLDTPLPEVPQDVVAHPTRPDVVYLLSSAAVRRSVDGGVTWSAPLAGLPPGFALEMILDPERPDHVFIANEAGVFRSLDGGQRWTSIGGGLPESFGHVVALAIDARDGRTLYVASSSGGLYRSTDVGATWKRLPLPADLSPVSLAVAGRSLYVATLDGVWVSRNRGGSFAPQAARLRAQRVADVLLQPWGVVAGTTLGVYRSADAGVSFAASHRGLRGRTWWQLEIDPAVPDRWYAVDRHRNLLRSANAGATWRATARELTTDLLLPPTFLTLDPEDSRIYAGLSNLETGGFLARSPDGSAWQALAGFGCLQPYWVLPDAARNRLFVGGIFLIGACGLQPNACHIHRSLDDGASFSCAKQLLAPDLGLLAVHPPTGDLLASSPNGLERSSDWGASWTVVHPLRLSRLQISTADPDVFWGLVQEPSGKYRLVHSTDRGVTWSAPGETPPGNLIPDPFDADRLYALAPQQLFASEDAGASWQLMGGSHLDGILHDIAFDPRQPDEIYAAATGGGLLRLRFTR